MARVSVWDSSAWNTYGRLQKSSFRAKQRYIPRTGESVKTTEEPLSRFALVPSVEGNDGVGQA
jgi:hypothetical protein